MLGAGKEEVCELTEFLFIIDINLCTEMFVVVLKLTYSVPDTPPTLIRIVLTLALLDRKSVV
jgi:hypothetical protein